MRGVWAELDVAAQRLELAHEKHEAVVNQVNELRRIVTEQDKVIAELKKVPTAPVPVVELLTSNTAIKNALTNLSTSTSNLGEALTFIPGSAKATLTSASPSVEVKPAIPPRFDQR
jgi:phage-related tail protein